MVDELIFLIQQIFKYLLHVAMFQDFESLLK